MRLTLFVTMVAVAGVLGFVADREARADGCFVWNGAADLKEPNQRAIICWDGKTETLVLAVKYEGPAEDFAWVVPLPAKPDVKAIDADKNPFAEISLYTQRRGKRGKGQGPGGEAVEVLERKVAGVYDIAILSAKDPEALAAWLKKNGYAFPDAHKDVLAHYTKKEWVYAAMRIDPKQLGTAEAGKLKTGELQPVRFAFASKEMVYPLKISSVNAGQTEVLLYLVADAPMVLASGPTAPGLEPIGVVLMSGRMAATDPEHAIPRPTTGGQLPLTWAALGLDPNMRRQVVTYRAVYKPDTMTDELAFKPLDLEPVLMEQVEPLEKAAPNSDATAVIAGLLAGLGHTNPELQMRLARHTNRRVREVVAADRKTPDAIMELLARDPDDGVRSCVALRQDVEGRTFLPQKVLNILADDKVATIRCNAAPCVASREVQERLAADPQPEVRRRLATNPGLSPGLEEKLAADESAAVRQAIAEHTASARIQQTLAGDTDEQVELNLTGNPHVTAEVLRKLAASERPIRVRLAAVHHQAFPADAMLPLVQEKTVRSYLAGNPSITPAVIAALADQKDPAVDAVLSALPRTPPEILRRLYARKDFQMEVNLAANPTTPADILCELAALEPFQIRRELAQNPATSKEAFQIIVDTEGPEKGQSILCLIAANPKAPPEILRALAAKPPAVQSAVAHNPNTPKDVFAAMAKKNDPYVDESLADSPQTPPGILRDLAAKKNATLDLHVAMNPSTPVEVLRGLAASTDKVVRCGLALNASAPKEVLEALAKEDDPYVDQVLARNPSTPARILRALAERGTDDVQNQLADTPSTPKDILETVAAGDDYYVARKALATLRKLGAAKP